MTAHSRAVISRVAAPESATPADIGRLVFERLPQAAVVHITGIDRSPEGLRAVFDAVLDTVGEAANASEVPETGEALSARWTDVRFDAALRAESYRHSDGHQPLHTDAAYDPAEGDLVLMYCEAQAPEGGATTFVAAQDLVVLLQRSAPALYEALCATPVRFEKKGRARVRAILSFDEEGPILTWNYYRVDPAAPPEVKRLAEEFHTFLEAQVVGSTIDTPIRLAPGDAVIWHDERVLHGRSAFTATVTGDRLLWKASIRGATQVAFASRHAAPR